MAALEPGLPKDETRVSSSEQPRHDGNMEVPLAKLSIYRIPDYIKDGDKKAYIPQVVSLGPYHNGDERLRPMEQHKLRCLHQILSRSHHEKGLYVDSVKEVEQRARACYEGTISMTSDAFVNMMVLDGCFVIELFRGVDENFEELGYPQNDPVFSNWGSMLKIQIMRDMILLENQIPLFLLDRLLSLLLGKTHQVGRVAQLAIQFFEPETVNGSSLNHLRQSRLSTRKEILCPSSNQLHCLKVLWQSLLPSDLEQKKTKEWALNRGRLISSVTELREAGIKLRKTGRRSLGPLGDIRFKGGILEIPQLVIHGGTRSLFLNLIAFEQSHFDCGNHITSYVIFMRNLINSPEDVRYLRSRWIINHCLGSDAEVADLFNRLCQEVALVIFDSYLFELSNNLENYCSFGTIPEFPDGGIVIRLIFMFKMICMFCVTYLARKWRSWIAILKSKYFDNPWSIISLIAAFVLLVLTFVQALYAVYGYYRPRS